MNNLKRLSRVHKKFLINEGLNPNDFMVERDTSEQYVFWNKHTGMLWSFYK